MKNQPNYNFEDLRKFIIASVTGTISLAVIGFVACKLSSKLGGPMRDACQAINLMMSLPTGGIIVLSLLLIGIIYKAVRAETKGERGMA